ncbi:MAG TPA: hypothetical protein VLL51_10030, partial [Gemmatimonadales bacterium]|nr:hypothetical protein [Gemmatimonadales bacterium]
MATRLLKALFLLPCLPALLAGQARPAPAGPPAGEWSAPARDLAGTRFSPLTDISTRNVSNLRMLWSYGTGSLEGHEGNPLVAGGRLYLHTPHPVTVQAFDLDRPGSPPLWSYAPGGRDPALAGCCGLGSRGIAWHPSGKLYVPLF